jgi:hypothetical protein
MDSPWVDTRALIAVNSRERVSSSFSVAVLMSMISGSFFCFVKFGSS